MHEKLEKGFFFCFAIFEEHLLKRLQLINFMQMHTNLNGNLESEFHAGVAQNIVQGLRTQIETF